MKSRSRQVDALHARAAQTAELLGALANTRRLLILCRLYKDGEASAGQLATELGMGLSAMSQHLARMREQGLISYRRETRHLFYRIADTSFAQLPSLLQNICADTLDQPTSPGDENMKLMHTAAAVLGLALTSTGVLAADNFWLTPTINGAGKIHPLPQAAYQPDAKATYKVVFGLTKGSAKPDQPNPGLERVARTVNLYANAGVPLKHLHFVAVASGEATAIALNDEQYEKQFGVANPNLPIIAQLRKAGVDIAVCGQAVAEHKYEYEWIDSHVTLALSALTTVTELQQKGYALMPL